jgi:hypothetical protein
LGNVADLKHLVAHLDIIKDKESSQMTFVIENHLAMN